MNVSSWFAYKTQLMNFPDYTCKMHTFPFSPAEQLLIIETYEEMKHMITKNGNTAGVIEQRKRGCQIVADRLNV